MTIFDAYDDDPRAPRHTCCGARVSIGAYGDWHHCEACEAELAGRHSQRRLAALTLAVDGLSPLLRRDRRPHVAVQSGT